MDAPRTLVSTVLSFCLMALVAGCDDSPEPPEETRQQQGQGQKEGEGRKTAATGGDQTGCDALPGEDQLEQWLRKAPDQGEAGGLFSGRFQWAAVVNRKGELCTVVASQDDAASMWQGSLAISKAKAYTANAFSTDRMPLSTARLYTMSQPGQPLWGIAAGNPFNTECLATPDDPMAKQGEICGGTIAFGGGLPLYKDGRRVGGLGVSGDTPCTDHEIAKRVREMAKLVPPGGSSADDIVYASVDGPSTFAHPLCPKTWRNGQQIGDASPVQGYQSEQSGGQQQKPGTRQQSSGQQQQQQSQQQQQQQ